MLNHNIEELLNSKNISMILI